MFKKSAIILGIILLVAIFAPVFAAPLFPDVPAEHWARDAVANLAAKGLLEGYPDGTFKGERSATRWETAMLVARLLNKMEQEHATFTSKADMDELRNLVNSLKDELTALGVRVGNIEGKVGDLDQRVTDLEKIRFSGEIDSIFVSNSFKYNNATYLSNGSSYSPTYWQNSLLDGRTFFLGSSLTTLGNFKVNAKINPSFSAGFNLAAFVAMGDENVSNFNGVSAPYLNNFFTQQHNLGIPGNRNNSPWTRVNLDSFFIKHISSGNQLTVGSFSANISPMLYFGQLNPNLNGPKNLNNQGFQLTGKVRNLILKDLDYELFYTKLADGNYNAAYDSFGAGLDVKWNFASNGSLKFNLMRSENDYQNSVPSQYFQITDAYVMQPQNASWSAFLQWTNPSKYTEATLIDPNKAPVNDGKDTRISPASNGLFALGPQSQYNYGFKLDYQFKAWKANAEFATTSYKPNRNSCYHKEGSVFDITAETTLSNGSLNLGLDYLTVSPYYDPMIMQYPAMNDPMGAWANGFNAYFLRLPDFSYFSNLYQLHNSRKYPNNRSGIRFNGSYKFAGENGKFNLDLGFLQQQQSSVYTQHHTTGGVAYTGFDPGWIEPIFTAISGAGTGAGWTPTENNKGKQNNYGIGLAYRFPNSKLAFDLGWCNYSFLRNTSLNSGTQISDVFQNYINLNYSNAKIGFKYPVNDRLNLKLGYEYGNIKGHHAGLAEFYRVGYDYNPSAILDPKADNLNFNQNYPYIGFDYQLTQNSSWGLNLQFLSLTDKVAQNVIDSATGVTNAPNQNWNGTQLFTEFKIRF